METAAREGSWAYYWSNQRRRRAMLVAWAFVAPVFLYTLVFRVAPVLASFFLSFTEYNMLTSPKWVGLENYVHLVTNDPLFWRALRNTAQFAVEVLPLNIAISLALAILVNHQLRGIIVFRVFYYLPVVTSIIAVSMIWLWVYEPETGLLNLLLDAIFPGIEPIRWLKEPGLALHSLVIMRVWKGVGWNMVIYLAGLQGIPQYLYEAARIDGAPSWQQFRHITWPMLRPVTYYILVMGIIGVFQTFGEVYAMTKGGPLDSTTTVGYLIYQRAFDYLQMGSASALSFALFGIIFALSAANIKYFTSQV